MTTHTEVSVSGIGVVTPPAGTQPGTSWFEARKRLGTRGYKYLPAACQYLVAAGREVVADGGDRLLDCDEERRAAVVGTNSAVAGLHDRTDRTLAESGAAELSPVSAPFFSVNLVASRLSTEHRLKGFALTVTSPRVAGIEALHVAANSLAAGRAEMVLAGGTESEEPHAANAAPEAGAVLFMLERSARARGYGTLRTKLLFVPPRSLRSPDGRGHAIGLVRRAVAELQADRCETDLRLVLDGSDVAGVVSAALRDCRDHEHPVSVPVRGPRAGALEPLALLAGPLRSGGDPVLVIVAAREGNVALALVATDMAGPSDGPLGTN